MSPRPYSEILARNIRATRSRKGIGQDALARRMRALGFDSWVRQTVGSTERPARRVTAEEIFGLSLALEVSMSSLLAPILDEEEVELPGGVLDVKSIQALAAGRWPGTVTWDGDVPVFGPGDAAWQAWGAARAEAGP